MKKSNKLLLLTALLPLIFITVAHLSLYAKYKAGDFITEKQEHRERYNRKEFSLPAYLSIKGVRNITIIPSDTFAIEYPKEYVPDGRRVYKKEFGPDGSSRDVAADFPVLHYSQHGDTLMIVGYDSAALKNGGIERKEEHSFPGFTLFCRGVRTMALEGAEVTIEQQERSALAPDSRILLKESQWIFGGLDENELRGTPYLYDRIHVQAENSKLDLNVNAVINTLEITLDSLSSLEDHSAQIGHLEAHWADRSQIQLSGANLRKLQAGAGPSIY